jgi:hypothetical protein
MKMKIWHFIVLVFAILVAFAIVHYFTHHQGQSATSAYLPS